jgi:hypothetical protein
VIHPGGALIGRLQAGLLEQAEVMILRASRDLEERRVRGPPLDFEADDVAVEFAGAA